MWIHARVWKDGAFHVVEQRQRATSPAAAASVRASFQNRLRFQPISRVCGTAGDAGSWKASGAASACWICAASAARVKTIRVRAMPPSA
jgi:hypothetical protein